MARTRLIAAVVGLGITVLLVSGISAKPGPDPNVGSFNLIVKENNPPNPPEPYELLHFDTSGPWDWGLRAAYVCAYVEWIDAGGLEFRLQLELVTGYPQGVRILDDSTAREKVNGSLGPCGNGTGGARVDLSPDGSPFAPQIVPLIAYKDGVPLGGIVLPAVSDDNPETYWSPGSVPGSAVMWYDEDALGNPVQVARMWIDPVAEGVSV